MSEFDEYRREQAEYEEEKERSDSWDAMSEFERMFAGRNGADAFAQAVKGDVHWSAKLKDDRYVWNAAISAAETRLWARVGNEEYGHAKAAVTLDIEAVASLKASPLSGLKPGEDPT